MKRLTNRLQGMSSAVRWATAAVYHYLVYMTYCVFEGGVSVLRFVAWQVKKRVLHSGSQVESILSRKGMPSEFRWFATIVFAVPVLLIRYALIGLVIGIWVTHVPQVWTRTMKAIERAERSPSNKRTPTKTRSVTRLSDFDDVRVRVSELTQ